MLTIFKELMMTAEEYIGDVETAMLERQEPGKDYTHDRIMISGVYKGRKYELDMNLEDGTK